MELTQGTPFYLGDDLRYLSNERKELLMNPEVLQVQQHTGFNPARLHHFNVTSYYQTQRVGLLQADCDVWAEKRNLVGLAMGSPELVAPDILCSSNATSRSSARWRREHARDTLVDDSEAEWQQQIWVSELDDGRIYLGIINAGDQAWWDSESRDINSFSCPYICHSG